MNGRCWVVVLWLAPGLALSHPLDPALLELRESPGAPVEVRWREPMGAPGSALLTPVLPERCRPASPVREEPSGQSVVRSWSVDCGARGLAGERLGVLGLDARGTDALVRVRLAGGEIAQAVLRGDRSSFEVPERPSALAAAREYVALGFQHILSGGDHLLFVLGLMLLVRGRRRLLATLTAFTAGHSVTLSLAALGVLRIPPPPVEALIAVSIFVVAVELSRGDGRDGETWARRRSWVMAALFGLLHGLGFAGALTRAGLPAGEVPAALLSFNVGIELGQLAFIAVALPLRRAMGWLPARWQPFARQAPQYVIGSVSTLLILDRVAAILGA
jgi:hydrogenase/urease accessory protein HupE